MAYLFSLFIDLFKRKCGGRVRHIRADTYGVIDFVATHTDEVGRVSALINPAFP
jgi:hypothetical protein